MNKARYIRPKILLYFRQRPYHVEYTASRPISEVKQRRVRLVLGWETSWEYRMLLAYRTLQACRGSDSTLSSRSGRQ